MSGPFLYRPEEHPNPVFPTRRNGDIPPSLSRRRTTGAPVSRRTQSGQQQDLYPTRQIAPGVYAPPPVPPPEMSAPVSRRQSGQQQDLYPTRQIAPGVYAPPPVPPPEMPAPGGYASSEGYPQGFYSQQYAQGDSHLPPNRDTQAFLPFIPPLPSRSPSPLPTWRRDTPSRSSSDYNGFIPDFSRLSLESPQHHPRRGMTNDAARRSQRLGTFNTHLAGNTPAPHSTDLPVVPVIPPVIPPRSRRRRHSSSSSSSEASTSSSDYSDTPDYVRNIRHDAERRARASANTSGGYSIAPPRMARPVDYRMAPPSNPYAQWR